MIQLQALSWIITNEDLSLLTNYGISRDHFFKYQKEFDFIIDHYSKYNKVPDLVTFADRFPEVQIFRVKETPAYLAKALQEQFIWLKKLSPLLKEAYELGQKNSFEAVDKLRTALDSFQSNPTIQAVDILHNTEERLETIKRRQTESQFIPTGFPEIDNDIIGLKRGEELCTILARTNVGKCFEKGTKVRMADGTTKAIEDIKPGDEVQSFGRTNTVLELHNGVSKGYKIIPGKGEPFVVSEGHVLTFAKNLDKGKRTIVDIVIEDYLKLYGPKPSPRRTLFRPGIRYTEKELPIPAYIFGTWLGDGDAESMSITSMDKEIVEEWQNYANSLGLPIKASFKQGNRAKTYRINCKPGEGVNPSIELLRKLKLERNKHIPLSYLTASRKQRLELLAGIVDTDGHLAKRNDSSNNRNIEIMTVSEQLAKDYVQLASGLGFNVNHCLKRVKHLFADGTTYKDYHRVTISGKLYQIPARLARKKAPKFKEYASNHTRFSIEPVEKVEYYGFSCDGDHRFLLEDNTLVHNSWFGMKLAENGPLKLNLDVGFYSGEMDIESQTFRFDTLFSNLNNTDLVQGDVNLERYKEYLEQIAKFKNHFYITTPQELGGYATVPKLEAFVNKYNLQYLVVDQLSLVEDARAQKGQPIRKTYDNICMDLFRLSTRYKIPVVLMCQANRKSLEKGPKGEMAAPGEGSASESDAIEHHSSKILSLFRKEDTLEVTVVKNRHGSKFHKYLYAIDYGHGTFKYIPTVRKENDSVQQRSTAEVEKDKQRFSKDKGSLF